MTIIRHTPRSHAEDVARALDPAVTGVELVALAAHRERDVRAAVASRADAPLASLISLAHETDAETLEALVSNPSSPAFVLRKIATDAPRAATREAAIARLRAVVQ